MNWGLTQTLLLAATVVFGSISSAAFDFTAGEQVAVWILAFGALMLAISGLWLWKAPEAKRRRRVVEQVSKIPAVLKEGTAGVHMGKERNLGLNLYLPDRIRLRHTHILGATGAGKTESVVLNFLRQDIQAGRGTIILDGKGDESFQRFLNLHVPPERLRVFDLGARVSASYDPLQDGSPAEAAQRLFSSLNWSEEYYKSKASSALQRIFHAVALNGRNPSLPELVGILSTSASYRDTVSGIDGYTVKAAEADYAELSGLRDQVNLLCTGELREHFRHGGQDAICLAKAANGMVVYFRLQSLMSRQLARAVGRLVINNLSFIAGSAHRNAGKEPAPFVPVYLDEFATFVCPEFSDLIAKARSAGFALHFSHQSIGDLKSVEDGFLNQLMDNSATKILLRVNDPETAEIFARAFGTVEAEKVTKRVTNADDIDEAESDGAGSLRTVRAFRASQDLLKGLPTGVGAVLIAHGEDAPGGASCVFQIKFPKL